MQVGKFYRITFDVPVHDLTVKVLDRDDDANARAEILEIHSGTCYKVGQVTPIYSIYLDKVEEVDEPIKPVVDGVYVSKNSPFSNRTWTRKNGEWTYQVITRDYDNAVRSGELLPRSN